MSQGTIPVDYKGDPTHRKYNLNCKIKFFNKNIREDIGKGIISQYTTKMVLLLPQESDECMRFYNAWMPDSPKEHFELNANLGSPVNFPARLSVHRGLDEKSEKPYLYVMTMAVADILRKLPEGQNIRVTTLSATDDDAADNSDTSEGNYGLV